MKKMRRVLSSCHVLLCFTFSQFVVVSGVVPNFSQISWQDFKAKPDHAKSEVKERWDAKQGGTLAHWSTSRFADVVPNEASIGIMNQASELSPCPGSDDDKYMYQVEDEVSGAKNGAGGAQRKEPGFNAYYVPLPVIPVHPTTPAPVFDGSTDFLNGLIASNDNSFHKSALRRPGYSVKEAGPDHRPKRKVHKTPVEDQTNTTTKQYSRNYTEKSDGLNKKLKVDGDLEISAKSFGGSQKQAADLPLKSTTKPPQTSTAKSPKVLLKFDSSGDEEKSQKSQTKKIYSTTSKPTERKTSKGSVGASGAMSSGAVIKPATTSKAAETTTKFKLSQEKSNKGTGANNLSKTKTGAKPSKSGAKSKQTYDNDIEASTKTSFTTSQPLTAKFEEKGSGVKSFRSSLLFRRPPKSSKGTGAGASPEKYNGGDVLEGSSPISNPGKAIAGSMRPQPVAPGAFGAGSQDIRAGDGIVDNIRPQPLAAGAFGAGSQDIGAGEGMADNIRPQLLAAGAFGAGSQDIGAGEGMSDNIRPQLLAAGAFGAGSQDIGAGILGALRETVGRGSMEPGSLGRSQFGDDNLGAGYHAPYSKGKSGISKNQPRKKAEDSVIALIQDLAYKLKIDKLAKIATSCLATVKHRKQLNLIDRIAQGIISLRKKVESQKMNDSQDDSTNEAQDRFQNFVRKEHKQGKPFRDEYKYSRRTNRVFRKKFKPTQVEHHKDFYDQQSNMNDQNSHSTRDNLLDNDKYSTKSNKEFSFEKDNPPRMKKEDEFNFEDAVLKFKQKYELDSQQKLDKQLKHENDLDSSLKKDEYRGKVKLKEEPEDFDEKRLKDVNIFSEENFDDVKMKYEHDHYTDQVSDKETRRLRTQTSTRKYSESFKIKLNTKASEKPPTTQKYRKKWKLEDQSQPNIIVFPSKLHGNEDSKRDEPRKNHLSSLYRQYKYRNQHSKLLHPEIKAYNLKYKHTALKNLFRAKNQQKHLPILLRPRKPSNFAHKKKLRKSARKFNAEGLKPCDMEDSSSGKDTMVMINYCDI